MSPIPALQALLGARCIQDPERLRSYEVPERGEPGHAGGLLLPETESELAAVLAICDREGAQVVLSAGRTGLVEAQRPLGELVLSLERLNRPLRLHLADGKRLDFDPAGQPESWRAALSDWWRAQGCPDTRGAAIETQAGLSVDALNALLEPLGLMFPMEMGSSAAATVGACAANASAGANALCYGTAAHMTETAWGYDGRGAAFAPCHAEAWRAPVPGQLAVDSARLRPAWGLLGAQGTLGVIARLRLRLYPLPAQREAVLLPVANMAEAMHVLERARAAFPDAVEEFEFMSRRSVELVRALRGEALRLPFSEIPPDPYLLLLQVKSQDADEDLAGRLYGFVSVALGFDDARIGYGPLSVLKGLRHSITESSNARMRLLGGGRLAFDTAAPIDVFGDYLDTLARRLRQHDPELEFVAFGHAGVGGAHLHLLGTRERPVAQQAAALTALVIDVTLDHAGTFSAEHGIGTKWAGEFLRRTPQAERAGLALLKRRHDPHNVLNPRSFGFDRLLQETAAA